MCIICVSPKGIPQPTRAAIRTMFCNNPHGAGYMVARENRVEIHKGFMTLRDLLAQLDCEQFTSDDVVVYHFRISTQAGVIPSMTHPFPLTSSLSACALLDLYCDVGVAHNGIITLTADPRDRVYNDTARYITAYMSRLVRSAHDLTDPAVLSTIYTDTLSRWALLDGSGNVTTVGRFVEEDGLLYSNLSYQPITSRIDIPRRVC